MRRTALLLPGLAVLLLVGTPAGATRDETGPITRLEASDDLLEDETAFAGDDRIHVVVTIPAGTDAVWSLTEDGDALLWEHEDGTPRVVHYLPYPGSYGAVPRTRRASGDGGSAGPLEALVLGPALARGAVVEARPIALLRLARRGVRGDTVLAVLPGTPLGEVRDLPELEERFPGVASIVQTWFRHAAGPEGAQVEGLEDADAARRAVEAASQAYEAAEED
jgi:inorganic pyrophosphatase